MLPSGGGIRVLHQFVHHLSHRFDISLHVPHGGSLLPSDSQICEFVYPYPMWAKPRGVLRAAAPVFLILRLANFNRVCKRIANRINESADIALVHNSMPVAAPPVISHLKIPSLYFCFEYPRHIFESDIIKRTKHSLTEAALKPLTIIEKKIDMASVKAATRVVTFSEYMKHNIKVIYGRNADIVRPGVNSDFFSPLETSRAKENYVLSVGAVWPFKGHDTAIKTVSLINRDIRPEIKIVGDREYPGYKSELMLLANSLSVKLTIHQGIEDLELRDMYRQARAVLCCQRREPYGLVPLESMACGTPVIAIEEGGFTDNIINSKTGFLFPGTPESAADLLIKILRNPHLGEETGFAGRDFVRIHRTISGGADKLGEMLELL